MTTALRIIDPGPLTTVQDRGRFGLSALGIGASGALDASSAAAANRLVGNEPGAAVLEVTMGPFVAVAQRRLLLTVTGADVPIDVDGVPHATGWLIDLRAGQRLTLHVPSRGVRSYIALRGGVDVPPVLGSRSTDTLGGLGPTPLSAADELSVGDATTSFPVIESLMRESRFSDVHHVRFTPGPRVDWFTTHALVRLTTHPWTITPASNRVGIRLDGPELERAVGGELASEGVALGSIQVPPSGPIVFHRDHPVTGGYPVIGVVETVDLDQLAQARAGERIRFSITPPPRGSW